MAEGKKIFIVEDERRIARFLQMELEHEGFETEIEDNGRRAYERIIQGDFDYLIELGLKGVKLHPDFQRFAMNEERAFKIGEVVDEGNVPMLVHCGDFRYNYSNPKQIRPFLERFPNITFIGAHFAGWSMWEEATRELSDFENLYVDLSSSLYSLTPETALELIHAYGSDRVLWGTDYPMWEAASEMEYFNKIDLTQKERQQILYDNAAKLLKLE